MKVGIIGSGDVGQSLGKGFASLGHEVKMGSRSPTSVKVQGWVDSVGAKASAGTFADASVFCDLAVLATGWSGTENAIRLADPKNLRGKVVIDVTNPLAFTAEGPPSIALGHSDSGAEQVQRWLPDSRVVKAFNIINNKYMVTPQFPGGPPDMFICGDDAGAKKAVSEICEAFGWPVIDIGGLEGARLLEPLALLWIICGLRWNSWDHAFKLLHM